MRISVQWDEVEPRQGEYDFSLTEELLRVAAEHDAGVMLSVGIKSPAPPGVLRAGLGVCRHELQRNRTSYSEDPVLRARALEMVKNVTAHFAGNDAVDSWSAENEPYIASHRSDHYSLSREYVADVVATIRANDPAGRPVAINHAQHYVKWPGAGARRWPIRTCWHRACTRAGTSTWWVSARLRTSWNSGR